MRAVHVLVNARARRGTAHANRVTAHIAAQGLGVVPIRPDGPESVAAALLDRREEIERLVIVGGDGLLHHALPAIVEAELEVGIVPSGTGNDVARSLGLPSKWKAATETALGSTSRIDALRVSRAGHAVHFVASVLTVGFSARVNDTANSLSFPRGQQKYTAATLLEARRLAPIDVAVTVSTDASAPTVIDEPCTFLAVGNTAHFGGGMAICPEASPTDGALHLTFVGAVGRAALLRMLPTVFTGRHVRHSAVTQAVGKTLDLDTSEELWADGERLGPGPATVEVLPDALRIAR